MFECGKFAQKCKVPLAHLESCYSSRFLENKVQRWLNVQERKRKEKVKEEKLPEEKNQKMFGKQKDASFNLMFDYRTPCLRKKEQTVREQNEQCAKTNENSIPEYLTNYVKHVSTPQYKRISPELLHMFKEDKSKRLLPPGQCEYDFKCCKCCKCCNCKFTQQQQQQQQECSASSMDFEYNNPRLTSYLRDVMESGNIQNDIHAIDYYNNHEEDDAFRCMKPDVVISLIRILQKGQKLNEDEKNYFENFKESLQNLNAVQLKDYLCKLKNKTKCSDGTMMFLRKLLKDKLLQNKHEGQFKQCETLCKDKTSKNAEKSNAEKANAEKANAEEANAEKTERTIKEWQEYLTDLQLQVQDIRRQLLLAPAKKQPTIVAVEKLDKTEKTVETKKPIATKLCECKAKLENNMTKCSCKECIAIAKTYEAIKTKTVKNIMALLFKAKKAAEADSETL